jgi:CRP-like cAMP-binding protein
MKILKSRIEKMIYLTDLEMDLLLSCFSLITLKKGDYILKKEDICDEIIFVNNGLLRFFSKENDMLKTLSYIKTSQIITSIDSFLSDSPSKFSIQAVIQTNVYVITKQKIEFIFSTVPSTQRIGMQTFEIIAKSFDFRVMQMLTMPPLERYRLLVKKSPEIINNVTLKELASFLNVTPQHLSRIRNQKL